MRPKMPVEKKETIRQGIGEVVSSNAGLGWDGIQFERVRVAPGTILGKRIERVTLGMVLSPHARVERLVSGRAQPVETKSRGQLTVFPLGSQNPMRLVEPVELAICRFGDEFLNRVSADSPGLARQEIPFRMSLQDESLRQLMRLLLTETAEKYPTGPLYVASVAEALAIRFWRSLQGESSSSIREVSALPKVQSSRVRDFIAANLGKNLSLSVLAKEAGYSRAHFLRMFRQSFHTTPHQYVLQRRMERAEVLLAEDRHSVAEIATMLGFSGQAHFTSVFRKGKGQAPAEFRRNNRKRPISH
jgi:AraC family transcriptional regulator